MDTSFKTFVVSKAVGGIGQAWGIVKTQFPHNVVHRWTKSFKRDANGTFLFHDVNYYFDIVPTKEESDKLMDFIVFGKK